MRQHHCLKCPNQIPANRRLCDAHLKHRQSAPSRVAAAPMLARILASASPTANGSSRPIITTADLLAIRGKSIISCTSWEFELAADLAPMWNEFLSGQPITSGVTL